MENKTRLIDANAFTIPKGFFNEGVNVPKILALVKQQPTVDAVEVVHGRWAIIGEACVCSACHKATIQDFYYCPNCGALMDLPRVSDQTAAALERIGANAHGGAADG